MSVLTQAEQIDQLLNMLIAELKAENFNRVQIALALNIAAGKLYYEALGTNFGQRIIRHVAEIMVDHPL